jgi:hypothetical protein
MPDDTVVLARRRALRASLKPRAAHELRKRHYRVGDLEKKFWAHNGEWLDPNDSVLVRNWCAIAVANADIEAKLFADGVVNQPQLYELFLKGVQKHITLADRMGLTPAARLAMARESSALRQARDQEAAQAALLADYAPR